MLKEYPWVCLINKDNYRAAQKRDLLLDDKLMQAVVHGGTSANWKVSDRVYCKQAC